MKCHLTIGPRVLVEAIPLVAGGIQYHFIEPEPRDCIGSECSAWRFGVEVVQTGEGMFAAFGVKPSKDGYCGLTAPELEARRITWPDPAAKKDQP